MEAYWTFDEKRTFILDKLKNKLTTKRFEHTLRVEKAARYLSKLHHGEHEKVVLAALLHDNAKNYPTDKKLKLCKKYSIALSHAEQQNIDLVHAKLGGVLAREKYGITDPDIINAVMYHTTGRPRMSLTEKIIYIADFIEPGRKEFPGLQKVRKWLKATWIQP